MRHHTNTYNQRILAELAGMRQKKICRITLYHCVVIHTLSGIGRIKTSFLHSKHDQLFFGGLNGTLSCTEPFLSTLQNVGVKFLQGVEKFQEGEVLFVQAAYKFLHAAKMHFMQLELVFFLVFVQNI